MSILDTIFPINANNEYFGHPFVIPIFWLITIISLGRSLVHIFKFDGGNETFASISLRKYPIEASETLIAFAAGFGISQLITAIVYVVILLRYKSLLSLGILLFNIEYLFQLLIIPALGKKVHAEREPPERILKYVFLPIGIILFWYSLPY